MQVLTDQEMQQVIDAAPEGVARAIEAAVLDRFEIVGHGLFDSDGKCHAIGQHRSSMCVGGKAFKSEPLYRLKETKC